MLPWLECFRLTDTQTMPEPAVCATCELHAEAVFRVEGMDCNEEVVILERRLKPLDGMEAIAAEGGYPLAAAALQFPLAEPCVASVLIGTAKPSSLERNMKLLDRPVAAAEFGRYSALTTTQAKLTGAVRE